MQNLFMFSVILMVFAPTADFRRAGKKSIRTPRCRYTFVVREVTNDNCPSSIQQPIQSDHYTLGNVPPGDVTSVVTRLMSVERQLNDEMEKNNNLNLTINKQEQDYKTNVSNILHLINIMQQTLTTQRHNYHDLEKKISGVKLDVEEMNTVLNNRVVPSVEMNQLNNKAVEVESLSKVRNCATANTEVNYRDCEDVYRRGHTTSGIYYITPMYTSCAIPVWCDMDTPPGGWLLLQRRMNGLLDFNLFWDQYKDGFGNVASEFWFGLDNMFLLTNQDFYELRVDLWDFNDNRVNAIYKTFKIEGERDKYRFHASHYEGSAKDSFARLNGMKFSTPDSDNDNWRDYHCALEWQAGWWYNNCWSALLNGQYHNRSDVKYRSIAWNEWKEEQLMRTEMKIRPSRLHYNNTNIPRR